MKTFATIFCSTLLTASSWSTSWADEIKVNITARVQGVHDPANLLGGQVSPGEVFAGHYRYDSSAPPSYSGAPNAGHYQMFGTMAGFKLARGSLKFESSPVNSYADVRVLANEPTTGYDQFELMYSGIQPLNSGVNVNSIYVRFADDTGRAPHTSALLTTAPELEYYWERCIEISGATNSDVYIVTLQIESVTLVPAQVIEISPGTSRFLPQQRFDAMLLAPAGSTILSAQAAANGISLPLSYPGTCTLAPPNSEGRPGLICSDAHTALATAPTATQVDWTVELSGGTVLNKSVEWKLIQ